MSEVELPWGASEGMGNVGTLVLQLVYGLSAFPRYKNKDQPFL